jgi:hypothetical protein
VEELRKSRERTDARIKPTASGLFVVDPTTALTAEENDTMYYYNNHRSSTVERTDVATLDWIKISWKQCKKIKKHGFSRWVQL